MQKSILLLSVFLFSLGLSAQRLKKFSTDRSLYLEELNQYLKGTKADKEKEIEPLILEFSDTWTGFGITDEEAALVIDISNNFLKKRLSAFQDWSNFLKIVSHLKLNEEEKYLALWLGDLKNTSKNERARTLSDYLSTTYLIFYENTLYDNGKVKWKVGSGDYSLQFDGKPIFKFDGIDLWGYFKNDSTRVEGTAGDFDPHRQIFEGNGGYAYFIRTGLSEDSAFVELRNFSINVSKTDFKADSVTLNTKRFLKFPVLGKYEEKLTSSGANGKGTFPRFYSYDQNIFIKDIVPGADFEGGLAIIGSTFYGGGSDSSKANVKFNYEGRELLNFKSDRFLLREDKLESNQVAVKISLKEDSIYHPKVTMRFLPNNRELTIIRDEEGLGRTAFSDSYHNLEMAFGTIKWNLDKPSMDIGNISLGAESTIIFESNNYYRGRRFDQLRGLNDKHVLYKMKEMIDYYGKWSFSNEEVAQFLQMDYRSTHILMMQMSVYGFVRYDLDSKTATFKNKVVDYVNNYELKRDYDVIQFVSKQNGRANAQLSLLDYAMKI